MCLDQYIAFSPNRVYPTQAKSVGGNFTMFEDFKEFAVKGNVLDMAVASSWALRLGKSSGLSPTVS